MTYSVVNVGTTPNDRTGDFLRNAFIIVNDSFAQTGAILDTVLTGTSSIPVSQIAGLQSSLDTIDEQLQDIPTIQSDITSINSDISSIQSDVTDLQDVVTKTKYYNPLDYGAVGNGVADDLTAFNNTISAANSNSGIVYIPSGIIIGVSDNVLIPSNTTIVGGNKFTSIIKALPTANISIKVLRNGDFTNGNQNISISNITIDGNDIGFDVQNDGSVCVELQKCSNFTLNDLVITRGGIEGIYLYLSTNFLVNNLITHDNGPFASEVTYSGDASGIHFDTCELFELNGCISYNNGFHGVICSGSKNAYIQATVNGNGFQGLFCQEGCQDLNVDINSYDNFRGAYLTDSTRINIRGTINNCVNGLLTRDSTNVVASIISSGHSENDLYLVGGSDTVSWVGSIPSTPVYTKEETTSILNLPALTIITGVNKKTGIGVTNPTANLHIAASTTTSALMRLTVGPAPTTPNDGDIWLQSNANTGLKIRINGITKTISLV